MAERRVDPQPDESLREAQDRFISIWGRMGSSWGIARTMAEVHALLFITGQPLNTDEVMARLDISRGNASMTIRALVDWGIVRRVHRRGDRKEYFEAEQDVWKLFRTVLRERKKREIDPVLAALYDCRDMTRTEGKRRINAQAVTVQEHNRRLDDMLEFMELVDSISNRFVSPEGKGLQKAATMLAKLT